MQCKFVHAAGCLAVIAVLIVPPSSALAQTSRGAVVAEAAAPAAKGLNVEVWSCSEHEQLRMPEKGACPLCKGELVATEIPLRGPGAVGDPYPFDTCPVSGEKLGSMGAPIVLAYDGREVRLCCKGCVRGFEKDPQGFWAQIDEKIIAQQVAHYPLETCVVSSEPLDEMGEPVNLVHGNRLVRFCCKGCVRAFKKDPTAALTTLDEAVIASQKDAYPLETCVVSGMKLGAMGEPVDLVYRNHLVRFCCSGCIGAFWKEPTGQFEKLRAAWATKHGHGKEHDDAEGHGGHDG